MNIEDVKKELNSYIGDSEIIEKLEEKISYYETKITSCTKEISDMPKGSPTVRDKMAEYIALLEDLKVEKIEQLISYKKKKRYIENIILKLDQPYKLLLYTAYIDGKSLTETAVVIKYDYKYTCKLHGIALNEYLKIREKER
jgi:DNA-directed RNA polymerase specialized sigma subunit